MAEAGTKEGRTQPDNGDETPSRRLQSPGAAHDELTTGFNELSAALTTYSVYAVYAVIGANWAIHGTAQTLLSNQWAKWSMVIAIGYVAVHLTCVGCMTLLYRRRCDYADHDKKRWAREYANNAARGSPWPYTHLIQRLGGTMRAFHVLGPLASGALLIVSMLAN